jgi:cytochrome c oxidase cbb3-type subunit III
VRAILLGALFVALQVALLPAPVAAADLAAAKSNFDMFCTKCHGPDGKGNGPAAATLSTKPRDFTDCARLKSISDETLFTAIKEGGQAVDLSKDMPAWKDGMEDDEIHDLVAFVRSLCKQ